MLSQYWFRIVSWCRYQLHAVGAHALHSPFVYTLFTEVLHTRPTEDEALVQMRQQLLQRNDSITFTDPRTHQTHSKTYRSLATRISSTHAFAAMLVRLIKHQGYTRALETGTGLGLTTCYLATSGAEVVTLEGAAGMAKAARMNFREAQLDHRIQLIEGPVQQTFADAIQSFQPQVVFLDADHRGETIYFYLNHLLTCPSVQCIIIHDIYWSRDMAHTWQQIQKQPQWPLTIDIYQAGLIFPRFEGEKQHFMLRF